MAGYSKNPLWKKLGIKEGYNCFLFQSPKNYFDLLEAIPADLDFSEDLNSSPYDFEQDIDVVATLLPEWIIVKMQ